MSTEALASRVSRVWPHVVAAFVVLHVVACLLDALPNPSTANDRRHWKEPRVQLEMVAWSKRLGMDKDVLEERLWALTTTWLAMRKVILAPVRPYLDASGVRQNWSMFAAGTRHRDRFQLRARACPEDDARCTWRALYTRGVSDEAFLREHLEHPRIRSGSMRWVWADHTHRYRQGCTALARRVFDALPEMQVVQCRFERSMAPSAHQRAGPSPAPTWERPVTITRADARGGGAS